MTSDLGEELVDRENWEAGLPADEEAYIEELGQEVEARVREWLESACPRRAAQLPPWRQSPYPSPPSEDQLRDLEVREENRQLGESYERWCRRRDLDNPKASPWDAWHNDT